MIGEWDGKSEKTRERERRKERRKVYDGEKEGNTLVRSQEGINKKRQVFFVFLASSVSSSCTNIRVDFYVLCLFFLFPINEGE